MFFIGIMLALVQQENLLGCEKCGNSKKKFVDNYN